MRLQSHRFRSVGPDRPLSPRWKPTRKTADDGFFVTFSSSFRSVSLTRRRRRGGRPCCVFGKEPAAADNLFGKTFRTDGVSFKSPTTKRPFLRFNYLPADRRRRRERHNPPPYILYRRRVYIRIYLSSLLDPRLVRPPSLNPFPAPVRVFVANFSTRRRPSFQFRSSPANEKLINPLGRRRTHVAGSSPFPVYTDRVSPTRRRRRFWGKKNRKKTPTIKRRPYRFTRYA